VLFDSVDSPGTTGVAKVSINGVGGDVILAVRDIDAATGEVLGDPNYGWRLVVKASERPELVRRLGLDCDDYYAESLRRARATTSLVAGIWWRFRGRASAPLDFGAWLDQKGIAYEFSSDA
jgi:hypothetical protein